MDRLNSFCNFSMKSFLENYRSQNKISSAKSLVKNYIMENPESFSLLDNLKNTPISLFDAKKETGQNIQARAKISGKPEIQLDRQLVKEAPVNAIATLLIHELVHSDLHSPVNGKLKGKTNSIQEELKAYNTQYEFWEEKGQPYSNQNKYYKNLNKTYYDYYKSGNLEDFVRPRYESKFPEYPKDLKTDSNDVKKEDAIPSKDKIDEIVAKHSKNSNVPILIGVVNGDNTSIYSYGDSDPTKKGLQKLDKDTLLPIGSLSKVYTTTLLADMVEKGEIDLDAPIQNYLPKNVDLPDYKGEEITVRDVATHTAGFSGKNLPNSKVSELFTTLENTKLKAPPGTNYQYSSMGTALLGEALGYTYAKNNNEKYIPEKSYENALKEHVLSPLGLKNTKATLSSKELASLPIGLDKNGKKANQAMNPFDASGGLYTTGADMLKFIKTNIDADNKASLGAPLNSLEAGIVLAHKPIMNIENGENGADKIGLSWYNKNNDITLKTASVPGFSSLVQFSDNKDAGVFVIVGQNGKIGGNISNEILKELY